MIQYFEAIVSSILIGLILLFEWYWRKNDRKKIHAYIDRLGGEIHYISNLALREHIYSVEYYIDDKRMSKTVKFTITQEEIWY